MAHQEIDAVLSAVTLHGRLLLSEDAPFDEVRAAYKRLLKLHPDKNSGNPRAAEAFKLVSAAFSELQKLHERSRGDSMAAQAAPQPRGADAVRSRWGAFTTGAAPAQHAWAPSAPQQPCPQPEQAAAAAPAPAGGSSKPRWGRPSNEIGQLLKPNSAPQTARAAAHSQALHGEAAMHPDTHENSEPAMTTSSPGNDVHLDQLPEHHRLSGLGVAPSAFYSHGSGGSSRAEQQAQRPAGSLYSMFAGRRSSGGGGGSYRSGVPAERPLSQPESQQEMTASGSQNHAADAGSRWGRQPSALAGLLRNPAPTGPAAAARGADQVEQPGGGKRGSKRARRQQQQSRIVESSDSEDGMTLHDDGDSSEDQACSSSDGRSNEDNGSLASSGDDHHGQAAQQAGDEAVSTLEAAVQQCAAGTVLAVQQLEAGLVQYGRKKALQSYYQRRGKGRWSGGSSRQATLKLVSVSSKRVKA